MVPAYLLIRSQPYTTNGEMILDKKQEKIKDPLKNTKTGKRKTNKEKAEAKKSKTKDIPVYNNKRVPVEEYKNPFDYFAFENNLLTAYTMKKQSWWKKRCKIQQPMTLDLHSYGNVEFVAKNLTARTVYLITTKCTKQSQTS
ncbi:unnamed protein product [Diabrotica balteata]|uniref:Uncharacterized protein n=1 Tax=Diabrotica balteata TaxID=107213 RepID=A0A9P0DXW7_DIABA|nr:unnamed protein product [Diabrotica balteata]